MLQSSLQNVTLTPANKQRLPILLVILMLILPIFVGLTTALAGVLAGVFWSSVFFSIFALLLLSQVKQNYSGLVFIGIFILFFVFWVLRKFTGFPFPALWQLFLIFSFFGAFSFIKHIRQAKFIYIAMVFFALFLTVGAISSFLGKTHFWPIAYQVLSDFKPILLIMAGFAIIWNKTVDHWFWLIVDWFWLPAIVLIVFEWAMPGTYFSIFKGELSVDPTGYLPSRAVGPFMNPSFLANSSAMFAMLVYSRMLNNIKQSVHDWFRICIYIVMIICSTQRQELMGLVVALMLLFILARPQEALKRSLISFLLIVGASTLFWMLFAENILWELPQWGIGTNKALEHPRAQIYEGAFYLANKFLPFGSGFGTYGGAGADKFDQTLYYQLGFGQYWWFGRENFLMDTYWPNSIAETGYLGSVLLLISYVFLFVHSVSRSLKAKATAGIFWRFCSAGMLFLLMLSLSAPAFQDPMLCFLPLLSFGIAAFHERNMV